VLRSHSASGSFKSASCSRTCMVSTGTGAGESRRTVCGSSPEQANAPRANRSQRKRPLDTRSKGSKVHASRNPCDFAALAAYSQPDRALLARRQGLESRADRLSLGARRSARDQKSRVNNRNVGGRYDRGDCQQPEQLQIGGDQKPVRGPEGLARIGGRGNGAMPKTGRSRGVRNWEIGKQRTGN
jgi:hypothetical protein